MIPSALAMARDLVRSNGDWDDDRLIKGLASWMRGWMPIGEQHSAERDAATAIKQARSEPVSGMRKAQHKEWAEKLRKAREDAGGRPGWEVDMLVVEGKATEEEALEFRELNAGHARSEIRPRAKKTIVKADSLPASFADTG